MGLASDIERWRRSGTAVVLARVVGLDGSGPRASGAAMAVSGNGEVSGSVSAGCVEGAVVAEALALLDEGPGVRRVVTFGYTDDDAYAVGLTCGGTVHLFLEPLDFFPIYDELRVAVDAGQPVVLATIIDGPGLGSKLLVRLDARPVRGVEPAESLTTMGTLGDPALDMVVLHDAAEGLDAGTNLVRRYGTDTDTDTDTDTVRVFIETHVPPARMLIFGAVDVGAALAAAAKLLGYHVTVCDAREAFATNVRFPMADEVVVDWPHRLLERVGPSLGPRDAICVLTHDTKFDVPAIRAAVATEVGYLGAMGSRRTHATRVEHLRGAGVSDEQLRRLHAPIGLDIGARSPEEVAVAVCAEIVALHSGRTGSSLNEGAGAIH